MKYCLTHNDGVNSPDKVRSIFRGTVLRWLCSYHCRGGSQRSVWPESGHRLLAAGLGGWAPGGHPSQPPFLEEEEVEEVVEGTLLLSHLSLATYLPSPHLMCTMMEKGDKKTQVALSGCFPGCSLPRSSDYLVVRRSPRRCRGLLRAL